MVNPIAQALAQPFIWGRGGAKLTPEQIAREREIADAMLAQGDPAFGGQAGWLGVIGRGLEGAVAGYNQNKADTAEQGNATASQSRIAALLSGIGGTPATPDSGLPAMQAQPMDPASARVAQAHGDFDVRQGLIDRGMAPHIADAFVMNFQDESGLNPGINEANPIVPGSRGGFGLSQWTGPRRRALEAYAAQQGVDVADPNMQLDYLMTELAGPESAAWQSIQNSPDTGSAAAAIVNQFLRPAEQHRSAREARYLRSPNTAAQGVASSLTGSPVNADLPMMGGGGSPVAQALSQAPQQQMAQATPQTGGINPAIIEALSSPYASEQERNIAGLLLNQQMQQSDPMRQLQMQAAQQGIERGALEMEALRNPRPEQTAEMQNLSWRAQQAGLQPGTPEYTQFMLSGGRPQEGVTVNNIMGGEKFGEEFAKGDAQALSAVSEAGLSAQRNLSRIDRLGQILEATPQGAMASWQQIAGQYGLNTEGLSNIQAAQALINSLVPEQRPPGSGPMSDADLELFKQSLPRIINQPGGNEMILNTMRGVAQYDAEGAQIVQALRRGEMDRATAFEALQSRENPLAILNDLPTQQGGNEPPPSGVDPSDWEFMTPEERALFQ